MSDQTQPPPLVYRVIANHFDEARAHAFFTRLVDEFYVGIESDTLLRPLYPDDLAPGKTHLVDFLVQYWGGPTRYEETRGHPRLRMRHAKWVIGQAERDAWFDHMRTALVIAGDDVQLDDESRQAMLDYFADAATFLMNDWQHGQVGRSPR